VRTVSIAGLPAAVASAAARGFTYRIAVIRFNDQAFRFLFATRGDVAALDRTFASTVASFRSLSEAEKASLAPLRIRVVAVGAGDTAETLSRRMVPMDRGVILFRALNGLAANEEPRTGLRVKIIVDR
jgi:predicted Zn-dependent protease